MFLIHISGGTAEESLFMPRSKPGLYYALHGIGICAVVAAGVLAGFNGEYRRLGRPTRAAFWILQITSITWAFIAYGLEDFVSWRAFGATGPLVWLACVLIFAGMDCSIWKLLDPVIRFIS
ncbi:MAG: hypothetical protein ACFFDN_47240, partial [Candidatus Hodarchaeota archaeon]